MPSTSPLAPSIRWAKGLNIGAAVVAIAAFVLRVVRSLESSDWRYAAAEWLTNYRAGFVRRGLSGELMSWVEPLHQKWALIGVVSTLFVIVVILQALIVATVIARLGNVWPLLVWLVPAGPLLANVQTGWQPFPGFVDQFMFRKEYLGYAIVLAVAVGFLYRPYVMRRHLLIAAASAGAVLAIAAFVHEALVIPAAAAVGVLFFGMVPASTRRRGAATLLTVVPAALVSLAFVVSGPSASGTAVAIAGGIDGPTLTWLGGGPALADNSPYYWLEQGAAAGVVFTWEAVVASGAWRGWLLVGFLSLAFAVAASWLADGRRETVRARLLALIVIGGVTAPLFLVGADTGRWISAGVFLTLNVALVLSAHSGAEPPAAPPLALVVVGIVLVLLLLAAGLPETGDPSGLLLGRRN